MRTLALTIGALLIKSLSSVAAEPISERSQGSVVHCMQITQLISGKSRKICYNLKETQVAEKLPAGLIAGLTYYKRLANGETDIFDNGMLKTTDYKTECLTLERTLPSGPPYSFCYDPFGETGLMKGTTDFFHGLDDALKTFAPYIEEPPPVIVSVTATALSPSPKPQPESQPQTQPQPIPQPQPQSQPQSQPQPQPQHQPPSWPRVKSDSPISSELRDPNIRHCIPMRFPSGELQRICFPDISDNDDLPLGCLMFRHVYGPLRNRLACFSSNDDDEIDEEFEEKWGDLIHNEIE